MLPLVEEVKPQLPRRADILYNFLKALPQISLDRLLSHAGQGNTELYDVVSPFAYPRMNTNESQFRPISEYSCLFVDKPFSDC